MLEGPRNEPAAEVRRLEAEIERLMHELDMDTPELVHKLRSEIERLLAALTKIETKAQTALDDLSDHSACAYACRDIIGMCNKELVQQRMPND